MRLSETDSFQFEQRGQAPGQAINVKNKEGSEVQFVTETEFYQLPGIASGPTKGDRLTIIQLEGGYEVAVASHNYRIGVSIQPGQVKIFSTDASGQIKQAEIFLDNDGKIKISNSSESIKDVLFDLIDKLIALKTFGSPANHTVDPSSVTDLTAIKTRLGSILK